MPITYTKRPYIEMYIEGMTGIQSVLGYKLDRS